MQVLTDFTQKSFSYLGFIDYVTDLLENGKATGIEQDSEKLEATKLNLARINRLDRTIVLNLELTELIKSIKTNWEWLLIMEGWCGDGAQIAPYINKLADLNDKIKLRIVLRDENPELMNNYLTDGTRSIPILICSNMETGKELGHWGPRPKAVVDWVRKYKVETPDYNSHDLKLGLHKFYTNDKGVAICSELKDVISSWKEG